MKLSDIEILLYAASLICGLISARCMVRMVTILSSLHGVGRLSYLTLHTKAMSGTWTGFLSGLCFGLLHVVAPDHIGTIITLSSATTKGDAFAVGASCGLGHSFGLVFVAAVFFSLRSAVTVNVDAWEYYGNYLIGASMITCGLYFMIREATFLVQNEDGTYTAQACACHPVQPIMPKACQLIPKETPRDDEDACMPCGDHLEAERVPLLSAPEGGREEPRSSVPGQALQPCAVQGRGVRGALIGLLQGACCPIAIVGLSFVAALPAMGVAFFLITFMAISSLGTASMAVFWAWATNTGICGGLSPRFAYRMSCCFTLILGILWVTANFCGVLDRLNYAEAAEHAQLRRKLDND